MSDTAQFDRKKTRRLAVIMDPIQSIKPSKDSTLAMLLAAQARGWETSVAEMKDIWIRDGQAFGRLTAVTVADDPDRWYEFGVAQETPLGDIDVILISSLWIKWPDGPFSLLVRAIQIETRCWNP
jgi:glutathione synthase/RimK-type ligase-like ATP-grasp enzyme